MKKIILFYLLLVIVLSLTACYGEQGYAFRHLQEMDVGDSHGAPGTPDNETEIVVDHGVFENLNSNLCRLNPHCCGQFTADEQFYYYMEQRAVTERNSALCYQLPIDELLVDCSNEESYVYYSQQRCLASFEDE